MEDIKRGGARREEIGLDLHHRDDLGLTAFNVLALSNADLVDGKVEQLWDFDRTRTIRIKGRTETRCIIL